MILIESRLKAKPKELCVAMSTNHRCSCLVFINRIKNDKYDERMCLMHGLVKSDAESIRR